MKKVVLVFLLILTVCNETPCQTVASFSEDKASLYKNAMEMFNEDNFEMTIKFCTNFLDQGRDADFSKLRAMAYWSQGDYNRAANDYTEAIQALSYQYPKKDPSLYFDRAMIFMCLRKFKEARSDLYEARRLFTQLGGTENFTYLENIGRTSHYLGDNKAAIASFKEAMQNGSTLASVDLLSALLQNHNITDLQPYCDSLLKSQLPGIMSNSANSYYISALHDIAFDSVNNATLDKINLALKCVRKPGADCFQGFYFDLLYARAFTLSSLGNDTAAYEDYRNIYLVNNNLKEVKNKIDDLKIKLGKDVKGPDIALRTPQVNLENTANVFATKGKYQIYGQVTDSTGVASVVVTANGREIPIPVTSIENDGLFETKIELQPGPNKIIISAVDKNENPSESVFYINFNEKEQNSGIGTDSLAGDDIPEISSAINYYALLIAEKDYTDDGFNDLATPVADARELKDILVGQYEFDEKNVKLLANAGRTEIIDTLYKICKMMTDADNLLVFYAGHGDVKRVNNQIEGGFIIPSDAKKGSRGSYISSEDLLEPVSTSSARHILFVVDACFGGALMRSSLDEAAQSIKTLYNNKSRRVLTSGNVEEVPDQGKFISNLKNFLRSPGGTYFSGNDLYTYILHNNSTASSPQFERIKNTGDAGGGQFIFVRKK
jgi:tetratricopeptide (TPR) repeat protein